MSNETRIVAFTYLGEHVYLTQGYNSGHFHVDSTEKDYETAREAREAIERKQKQEAAVQKESISLPILDTSEFKDGKPSKRVISGIHAGTGRKLYKPKREVGSYSSRGSLYPDVPWIEEAAAEEHRLRKQADRIHNVLSQYELSSDPYSSQGVNLPARYKHVKDDYAQKKTDAESTNLEAELKLRS